MIIKIFNDIRRSFFLSPFLHTFAPFEFLPLTTSALAADSCKNVTITFIILVCPSVCHLTKTEKKSPESLNAFLLRFVVWSLTDNGRHI